MWVKVLKWIFFTIIVSWTPLIAAYYNLYFDSHGAPSIGEITAHGEFYLVSSALCATSAGEMVGTSKEWLPIKIAAAGAAFVIIFLSVNGYAKAINPSDDAMKTTYVVFQIWTLIVSCVVSTGCIALSEVQ